MISKKFIPCFGKVTVGQYQKYEEIKSSLPVCVAIATFWSRRHEKTVLSLYVCLNIYHMFEFCQEQHLLKNHMDKEHSPTNTTFLLNTVLLTSVDQIVQKLKHVHDSFQDCFTPDHVPNMVS